MSNRRFVFGRRRFLKAAGSFGALVLPPFTTLPMMLPEERSEEHPQVVTLFPYHRGPPNPGLAVFYTGFTGWYSVGLGPDCVPTYIFDLVPSPQMATGARSLERWAGHSIGPSTSPSLGTAVPDVAELVQFFRAVQKSSGGDHAPYCALLVTALSTEKECREAEVVAALLASQARRVIVVVPADPGSAAPPRSLEAVKQRLDITAHAVLAVEVFPAPWPAESDLPAECRICDGLVRVVDHLATWAEPGSIIGVDLTDVFGRICEAGGGRLAAESFVAADDHDVGAKLVEWMSEIPLQSPRSAFIRASMGPDHLNVLRLDKAVDVFRHGWASEDWLVLGLWPDTNLNEELEISAVMLQSDNPRKWETFT